MNEVLLFLLRSNKLLLDPAKLPALLKLNRKDWSLFVDEFRGMIVTCPGRVGTYCISHCMATSFCFHFASIHINLIISTKLLNQDFS